MLKSEKNLGGSCPRLVVAAVMSLILFLWVFSLKLAYPEFQAMRSENPFAEISALIPMFSIVVALYLAISLFIVFKYNLDKMASFIILATGAIILWYTPYAIAGYVKQTDTLWHMGMAANLPDILSGNTMPFASYAVDFPISYAFGYTVASFTGLDVTLLANYVMPMVYILLFVFAYFILFCQFVDNKIAMLTTMVSIGLMYHVALHQSPQVVGTLLLILCMTLVIQKNWKAALLIAVFIPFTHIISFAFLGAFLLMYFTFIRGFNHSIKNDCLNKTLIKFIFSVLTILFGLMVVGVIFSDYLEIFLDRVDISNAGSFILDNLLDMPWFKLISSVTYIVTFILFMSSIYLAYRKRFGSLRQVGCAIRQVEPKTLLLITLPPICLVSGIVIALADNSAVLIERGVAFFMLFATLFMMTQLATFTNPKNRSLITIIIVLAVCIPAFVYPFASYSIDSYNSFPISEQRGLEHLVYRINVQNVSIEMSSPGQLDAYISPENNVTLRLYGGQQYDFIIFRKHAEIRQFVHDPDSRDIEIRFHSLGQNISYAKIYSNPNFAVFMQTAGG
ncbi:MAG: hypothetical protein PHU53_01160 [Thermoplasmata archaeon]|nr:hypothetical protein [Thermoplasmata archaeon]